MEHPEEHSDEHSRKRSNSPMHDSSEIVSDEPLDAGINSQADAQADTQVDVQANVQADTQVDAQADTQVDAQIDTQVDAQIDTQVDAQIDAQVDPKSTNLELTDLESDYRSSESSDQASSIASSENSAGLVQRFQQAVEGLLWTSESDYPFTVQVWQGQPGEEFLLTDFLQASGNDRDSVIQAIDLQDFLRPVIQAETESISNHETQTHSFRSLLNLIESTLNNTKVYRVGEIEIDIYVIGQMNAIEWLVLSTKTVET